MLPLSAWDLLNVWEHGLAQPPPVRALLLLLAVTPEASFDELADLSIGQRDGRLLALREQLLGPMLSATSTCPSCGERVEFSFAASDVKADDGQAAGEEHELVVAGYHLRLRPPNSDDLLFIAGESDPALAEAILLERSIVAAERDGEPLPIERLPEEVRLAGVASLAAADPQADSQLDLICPTCSHNWQALFDIATYLWHEIESWAVHLLREVHDLARAYGWREADILAMSSLRRQLYLEIAYG